MDLSNSCCSTDQVIIAMNLQMTTTDINSFNSLSRAHHILINLVINESVNFD